MEDSILKINASLEVQKQEDNLYNSNINGDNKTMRQQRRPTKFKRKTIGLSYSTKDDIKEKESIKDSLTGSDVEILASGEAIVSVIE